MIIDGKIVSAKIIEQIKIEAGKPVPGLVVIQVGNDPASTIYVNRKEKACKDVGFYSEKLVLPETTSQKQLLSEIQRLNKDKKIHGILVQIPLPKHIDTLATQSAISPLKDVDGLHPENIGLLCAGTPRFSPCTPLGVIRLLDEYNIPIEGKHAVVVGRSNLVGKPLAQLLLLRDATVTVCHRKTSDLISITKQADILISAVGKPGLITVDHVKKGAAVIDVGTTKVDGKLLGDVDFPAVEKKAAWITPVPGGVGPLTIAMLLSNTLQARRLQT